ncbi:MAG: histidinol-phosphate transaminase, partial [Hymenobacteraceae bacterium]|nr:histidinol-phosphate transaminase [Hymenobacteraceae bacterium]
MFSVPYPPYRASSNENLFGVSPKVKEALQNALTGIGSYPDPDAAPLREAIAQRMGVQASEILVGSGSAELISLLVRTFCKPYAAATVLSLEPTYPLYRMEAESLGVAYATVPLNSSFKVSVEDILAKVNTRTRLCFISNPNNPTGGYLTVQQLEQLLQALPPQVVLVLDEAYREYVTAPDFGSALPYLRQYPNLVMLRTFSKAYGLASLRVGYMVAGEELLAQILQVKQPFNVNQLAQVAASAALEDKAFLAHTLQATCAGKLHLQQIMQQVGVQTWPSEGNFLLADAGVPGMVLYKQLQAKGIQVRATDDPFALRITVGPEAHQQYLHHTLQAMLTPEHLFDHPVLAQILKAGEAVHHPHPKAHEETILLTLQANPEGDAAERIALAYSRAFGSMTTADSLNTGNLYSASYGTIDMISAFNVLVGATPLVTFGHQFSNRTIAATVADARQVHILDLGIGSGLQWLQLLGMLAQRPGGAPEVHLTGIDIPAPEGAPDQRLQQTGAQLQSYADNLGISLTYDCIAAKLEELDLTQLPLAPAATLVVNAAFTLHHLPDQLVAQPDYRDRTLRQIKALQPAVFTLTEPDSEHNKLEFMPRLRESLRHYFTVFDVLDTLLPQQLPERQIIEQEFFGREIINVISCEGA